MYIVHVQFILKHNKTLTIKKYKQVSVHMA